MPIPLDVQQRMKEDWNRRAAEDAHYYVAFGRQHQDEEEFYATAADVLRNLEAELKRLPPGDPRARRALEVGCGPGRLLKPMSRYFGELHGVDVSDEMVALARERLRFLPHVHVHATAGSDLAQFASGSFAFVYSYAVFQHIPSRDVVLNYLAEIARVLQPGGIARLQINGLPAEGHQADTWSGARFSAAEIAAFVRAHGLQLLALSGLETQYMWTTLRKPLPHTDITPEPIRVQRITNANSTEPVTPARGRYAAISLWVEGLPDTCDLHDLTVRFDGLPGIPCYFGPRDPDGVYHLNVFLPSGVRTGLVPISIQYQEQPPTPVKVLRVIPASPLVPRTLSITDGINLMSERVIETGTVKVTMEDIADPTHFTAAIDRTPIPHISHLQTDPLSSQYEFTFAVPPDLSPGLHNLVIALGARQFPISIVNSPGGQR